MTDYELMGAALEELEAVCRRLEAQAGSPTAEPCRMQP